MATGERPPRDRGGGREGRRRHVTAGGARRGSRSPVTWRGPRPRRPAARSGHVPAPPAPWPRRRPRPDPRSAARSRSSSRRNRHGKSRRRGARGNGGAGRVPGPDPPHGSAAPAIRPSGAAEPRRGGAAAAFGLPRFLPARRTREGGRAGAAVRERPKGEAASLMCAPRGPGGRWQRGRGLRAAPGAWPAAGGRQRAAAAAPSPLLVPRRGRAGVPGPVPWRGDIPPAAWVMPSGEDRAGPSGPHMPPPCPGQAALPPPPRPADRCLGVLLCPSLCRCGSHWALGTDIPWFCRCLRGTEAQQLQGLH